jgi:hypothetical protein
MFQIAIGGKMMRLFQTNGNTRLIRALMPAVSPFRTDKPGTSGNNLWNRRKFLRSASSWSTNGFG